MKAKLTPIPRRRSPASGKGASRSPAGKCERQDPPDLSRIAESLRPLATPLADVTFLAGNAVRHPEKQVEQILASLRQFGQVEPLIVNRRETPPVVIGGNGRLQAMLAEGWTHGAVCFVDLPKARANALALILNRTADGREWDADALLKLIEDINTGNDERLDEMIAELAKEEGLAPGDAGGNGKELTIIIKCSNEADQAKLFDELAEQGYSVRKTGRGRQKRRAA